MPPSTIISNTTSAFARPCWGRAAGSFGRRTFSGRRFTAPGSCATRPVSGQRTIGVGVGEGVGDGVGAGDGATVAWVGAGLAPGGVGLACAVGPPHAATRTASAGRRASHRLLVISCVKGSSGKHADGWRSGVATRSFAEIEAQWNDVDPGEPRAQRDGRAAGVLEGVSPVAAAFPRAVEALPVAQDDGGTRARGADLQGERAVLVLDETRYLGDLGLDHDD